LTITRDAVPNDLGEHCQIIIGKPLASGGNGLFGYVFTNTPVGTPAIKFKPQRAKTDTATYISSADHLTMRDAEDSRVFVNDWRKGAGQVAILVDDPISKARFYDSNGVIVSDPGRFYLANAMSSVYAATIASTLGVPLLPTPGYLYMGAAGQIMFSATWTGAPSVALTSTAGAQVNHMATDSTYVYAAVQGVGINRFALGATAVGTIWNSTANATQRLLYSNRKLYAISGTAFSEISIATSTETVDFTPPAGWFLMDLCAKRGASIDAPIIIAAHSTNGTTNYRGDRTMTWYWDGATIHDYIPLPIGFSVKRMIQYLGVIYLFGAQANSDGTVSPAVYYILNDTLGFLGFLGVQQSNNDPTAAAVISDAVWGMDATGTFVYFSVNAANSQEVWRYDIINGGLTRYVAFASSGTLRAAELACYGGAPWVTVLNQSTGAVGLYGSQSTYVASGSLDTSDLHLGQPWDSNLWLKVEGTTTKLLAGEQVALSYSLDGGVTWTSAGAAITAGANSFGYLLSTLTQTIANPYLRLRTLVTAGTGQLTTPSVLSLALKADPQDPTGANMEVDLSCADNTYMPNEGPDWQGASGQERLANIVSAYENQAVIQCIYMAPSITRAKNPKSIPVIVNDYEITEHSSVGLGPNKTVEGSVKVFLREVT
jgi:hypothetical protein